MSHLLNTSSNVAIQRECPLLGLRRIRTSPILRSPRNLALAVQWIEVGCGYGSRAAGCQLSQPSGPYSYLLRLHDIGHLYIPLRSLSFAQERVLVNYHSPHRTRLKAWGYHFCSARAQIKGHVSLPLNSIDSCPRWHESHDPSDDID